MNKKIKFGLIGFIVLIAVIILAKPYYIQMQNDNAQKAVIVKQQKELTLKQQFYSDSKDCITLMYENVGNRYFLSKNNTTINDYLKKYQDIFTDSNYNDNFHILDLIKSSENELLDLNTYCLNMANESAKNDNLVIFYKKCIIQDCQTCFELIDKNSKNL